MTDSKTASSEERPAAVGKTVTKVVGKPVQPDFEIRYHPKRPFSYEVAKYGGGIHTVVERLGRPSESGGSLVKAIRLQYGTWKRVLPYLIRFAKDTITPLGKRRVSLCEADEMGFDCGGAANRVALPASARSHMHHSIASHRRLAAEGSMGRVGHHPQSGRGPLNPQATAAQHRPA